VIVIGPLPALFLTGTLKIVRDYEDLAQRALQRFCHLAAARKWLIN
jgi:hypothetical protein